MGGKYEMCFKTAGVHLGHDRLSGWHGLHRKALGFDKVPGGGRRRDLWTQLTAIRRMSV
jgi:hypothetical protein